MLRTDRNILEAAGLGKVSNSQTPRGRIDMDSADLVLYKADGQLAGSFLGIPIYRKASLANGIYEYDDDAGTELKTNAE